MNRRLPASSSFALMSFLRRKPLLRGFSLLLASCCFWSFAGAGAAMAAAPDHSEGLGKSQRFRFPHAPLFQVPVSPFAATHGITRTAAASDSTTVVSAVSPASAASLAVPPAASSETLWNDTGHLMLPVAGVQVQAWTQELKTTHPSNHRAAELHLWLGEVAVAQDKQPNLGMWHFRIAQHLASAKDPLHYLAAYDKALGLFYAGAYQESEEAFTHLLAVRHTADGFNRQHAALWLRHVSGCVGYHAQHSDLGIPEPPRLDPLCAAAALAARLRVMGLPSDRGTLLRACRVTGEGSNMQDILDAASKLGVHAQAVTADDRGLMALPKPVVAYVEHDHFVALTRADKNGVSYLCSDCGPWPGGRVDLTWKQWHTMDAGLYVVVTPPDSAWDRTLTALKMPGMLRTLGKPSRQIASNHLTGVLPRQVEGLVPAWPALRGHVVLDAAPAGSVSCGTSPPALYCTPDSNHPTDKPGASKSHAAGASQEGDPVDLATGQEEYGPNPDLVVYNQSGPSITWQRTYETLRGPGQSYPDYTYDGTYQSDDFGTGWSQPYNVGVIVSGSTASILFANGGKIAFTFSGSPTSGHPLMGTPSRSGVPFLLQWDYDGSANGHYEVIFKDRTHWITGSAFAPGSVLPLAQITDCNGNSVYFNYPTISASKASHGWPLLGSITTGPNATGTVLLSIQRNTTAGSDGMTDSYITSVTDHPGTSSARSVFYQAVRLTNPNCPSQYSPYYSEVSGVSQIVPGGSAPASAPSRFAYAYKAIPNGEGYEQINCLHTVRTPSPTGSGTSTAYFWYMNDNTADANGKTNPNYISSSYPFVGALVDANGNRRLYYTSDGAGNTSGRGGNYTQVTVQNSSGTTLYLYQVSYDSNLNETVRTDGNGHVISQMSYANASSPYSPSTVADGNVAGVSLLPATKPGVPVTFSSTGTATPLTPDDWKIVNSAGTVVASDSSPSGWTLSYTVNQAHTAASITLTPASNAALGQYQADCGMAPGSPYRFFAGSFTVQNPAATPARATTYTYDQYGNVLTQTSPRGTVTTYSYNYSVFPLGEMTQAQEGTNLGTPKAPTTYAYDDSDGYIDANGVFQPCGLLSSVAMPLPGTVGSTQTATTSYTYDVTGKGHQPLGQLGLGNVLTLTRPGNNAVSSITTTMGYTSDGGYSQAAALGQPLTIMDNLGKTTHLRYDSQGNTVGVKDALGNETDTTYTIGNLPLQTVLPATGQTGSGHAGSQISYLYSEPSALATSQWPAVTLQYGPAATTTQYDESAHAIRQVVSGYGPEGELLAVSGSTEPVSYTYDALYRLSTLKDAAGNRTSYFYNPAGYLAQVVYPGAGTPTAPLAAGTPDTISFPSYDGAGNRLSRTDGNNVTTTYTYNDPESRLTDITYPSGTIGNIHFAYDAYGRRPGMTDGTGGQTYAYDDDDELTSKNITWNGFPAKTISYGFYPNGSRQSMNADGHSFSYGYDAVGRMNSLTNDNSETTTYSYQDNGWLLTKTLANRVITTFSHDPQGRLTDLANRSSGGTMLSDFSVPATGGYDGIGNRLSVTATMPGQGTPFSGTTSYQYDYGQSANPALNRSQLTGEASTRASGTFSYGYDGGTSGGPGNLTSFKGIASAFNADNQLTNSGYSYDGDGNPTTFKTIGLTFDPENRLTTYGSKAIYAYDGDGHRVEAQQAVQPPLTTTYYLYDGDVPVITYSPNGTALSLASVYTFGTDGLVSTRSPVASLFYTYDPQGNVAELLSSNAAVQFDSMFDAYGNGYGNSFGFGAQWGYIKDQSTSLIFCTHRYYDPSTGRWLTRDPIRYKGGVNLYGYVKNNPIKWIDPKGYGTVTIGVGGNGFVPGAGIFGGGFDGGISIDSSGTIAYSGDVYGLFPPFGGGAGVGASPEISYCPSNLPDPDDSGVSEGGSTFGGGFISTGIGGGSITSPGDGSSPPTYTISLPSPSTGGGGIGGAGGSVGFNLLAFCKSVVKEVNSCEENGVNPW